jgi:hypothetical protein
MDLLIRPYNSDGKLLASAIANGARVSGLVVDAHIAMFVPDAVTQVRSCLGGEGSFLVDPVTFKMRYPFFRNKRNSYQRLPYYYSKKFTKSVPPMSALDSLAPDGALKVFQIEQGFGATEYISPYLYADVTAFRSKAQPNPFDVGGRWTREFLQVATGRSVYVSLCLSVACLTDPDSLDGINRYLDLVEPQMIYMLLFDYEMGENPVVDAAVRDFLANIRRRGVRRIIYSHAPPWIYFMGDYGIDAFVSGINYLTTLKEEYLEREDEIGSIQHNYYIPRRFCRMNVKQASAALKKKLFPACRCPACNGYIPDTQNLIREHYIHAKAAECDELRRKNPREVLAQWGRDTVEFLYEAGEAAIKVYGDPKPTQWLNSLS